MGVRVGSGERIGEILKTWELGRADRYSCRLRVSLLDDRSLESDSVPASRRTELKKRMKVVMLPERVELTCVRATRSPGLWRRTRCCGRRSCPC
jgi:hypothetical protein